MCTFFIWLRGFVLAFQHLRQDAYGPRPLLAVLIAALFWPITGIVAITSNVLETAASRQRITNKR